RRRLRRQVLEAVDGDVDIAAEQRLLDLAHEESLAADGGQPGLGEAIALGPHGDELHVGAETGRHAPRLRQGQGAAAGADANHERRPSANSSWTSSSHERPAPARDDSRSLVIGAWSILFTIAVELASMAALVHGMASGLRVS